MESFIKADVFFFVTTVSLIIVSAILVAVLIYILRIVRDILHLVKHAREEGDQILKDINNLRTALKEESKTLKSQWKNFLEFISFKKGLGKKSGPKKNNGKQ